MFYSIRTNFSLAGLCMKKRLGHFEKLSKTQKRPYLYQKVNNKNLGQLANKKTFYKKITLFSMLASFELQTSNLPRPPP